MSIIDKLQQRARDLRLQRAKKSLLQAFDVVGQLAQDQEVRDAFMTLMVKGEEIGNRENAEIKKIEEELEEVSEKIFEEKVKTR